MKNIKLLSLFVALFFAKSAFSWDGTGTSSDPYLIKSTADWNELATQVVNNTTDHFANTYFKLDADISVTTKIGAIALSGEDITYNSRPFAGHFDGGGHTLTVTYGTSVYQAPFCLVSGGSIKHLHVAGDITTNRKYASGLIGAMYSDLGTYTIEDCRVSVAIHCSTGTADPEAYHAGFIARANNDCAKTINLFGCVFDGKFISASTHDTSADCGYCAGFVNKADGNTINLTNCLFAPTQIQLRNNNETFVRGGTPVYNKCYCTHDLPGDNSGKMAYSVTGVYGVAATLNEGDAVNEYGTSGINQYSGHLTLNGVPYVITNEDVMLKLSGASSYSVNYGNLEPKGGEIYKFSTGGWSQNRIIKPTSITITAKQDPLNKTDYYTTLYYESQRFTLPNDGTEAYAAEIDEDEMILHKIAENDNVIPNNYAMVLKAPGSSITLLLTDNSAVSVAGITNHLKGVEEETAISEKVGSGETCYVISGKSADNSIVGVGFYKYEAPNKLQAHKAYAVVDENKGKTIKRFPFVFEGENTATAVEDIQNEDNGARKFIENGMLIIERDGVHYNAQGARIN